MRTALIASGTIGVVTILGTLAVGHAKSDRATPEYGRRFMESCSSCHIDAGADPGELSLIGAISHYPGDKIRGRINECFTRNMNRQPIPEDGTEMNAMIAWLHFLADENAARPKTIARVWQESDHKPDANAGAQVFEKRCADCHGKDGAGLAASRDPGRGWLFPPLWGRGSFPSISEMNNISTLARFIHAKMPLGRADLGESQALDIAAFLLSQPRAR